MSPEEIRIKKLVEQWAGKPHEQLLNQSFTDQLNSVQLLIFPSTLCLSQTQWKQASVARESLCMA